MSDSISSCKVSIDGVEIEDFKSVKFHAIETGREVQLMNKTKYGKKTKRYGFTLDYVVPSTGEFDWSKLETRDGTAIFTKDNGSVVTYYGVRLLEKGEETLDGDSDVVIPMKMMATKRDPAL